MNRALPLLVGLVAVLGGSLLWARWWVNSVELPKTAMAEPMALPSPLPLPVARPRSPVVMAPPPSAITVDGGASVTPPVVTQLLPLQQATPLAAPEPPPPSPTDPVSEPPEFRHLRRLRDPGARTRLPPPNNPRIQLEPYLRP